MVPRDLWGPLQEGGTPAFLEVLVRRYRCLTCHAVVRVGPRGILPRKRYSGSAIAAALALWAIFGREPALVRETVSPWRHVAIETVGRWASLGRWASAADQLWPLRRPPPDGLPVRELATQAVRALVARLPGSTVGPIRIAQVFAAAQAGRGGS